MRSSRSTSSEDILLDTLETVDRAILAVDAERQRAFAGLCEHVVGYGAHQARIAMNPDFSSSSKRIFDTRRFGGPNGECPPLPDQDPMAHPFNDLAAASSRSCIFPV